MYQVQLYESWHLENSQFYLEVSVDLCGAYICQLTVSSVKDIKHATNNGRIVINDEIA